MGVGGAMVKKWVGVVKKWVCQEGVSRGCGWVGGWDRWGDRMCCVVLCIYR